MFVEHLVVFVGDAPEVEIEKQQKPSSRYKKQFKLEYSKPHIFDLDTDMKEMVYHIRGSRLNPSILEKQENKIANFIENIIFRNYGDGEIIGWS